MINIRISETNEIKTLSIVDDNGVDWVQDLIGNTGALQNYDDETDSYEMNLEDYEWWENYINNYLSDEQEIAELAEELEITKLFHHQRCQY